MADIKKILGDPEVAKAAANFTYNFANELYELGDKHKASNPGHRGPWNRNEVLSIVTSVAPEAIKAVLKGEKKKPTSSVN